MKRLLAFLDKEQLPAEAVDNPRTVITDDGKFLDVQRWAVSVQYNGAPEKAEEEIGIALKKYCEENKCQIRGKNIYSIQNPNNGFCLAGIVFVERI